MDTIHTKFYAFGTGDQLAIPQMHTAFNTLACTIAYTKPSFEPFYSRYGFAYPISISTPTLDTILDDAFPIKSDKIGPWHVLYRYVLIDHDGNVWKVLIQEEEEGKLVISYGKVHTRLGWWITSDVKAGSVDTDRDMLVGFLSTDPTREQIDAFWATYQMGETLNWFSIDDIVKKLNIEYPDVPREDTFNKAEIKRQVMNVIDILLEKKFADKEKDKQTLSLVADKTP
jgi:hypothetical protein